jgi:N-acetylglucosamine malate deacetylase 2
MDDGCGARLAFRSVLAVCAHPDDESFGLGAALSTFSSWGVEISLLCFTHGEASTLGPNSWNLATIRADELSAAGAVLGIGSLRLLAHPDGALADVGLEDLCDEIDAFDTAGVVDCLLVFDEGGITGHPDHQRATQAAMAFGHRRGIPVLAWALPEAVTSILNSEFGAGFVGRAPAEIDLVVEVNRDRQHQAISCHASQSSNNPVLRRRLALQGSTEWLRWLSSPTDRRTISDL